jgi:hypothetical protein
MGGLINVFLLSQQPVKFGTSFGYTPDKGEVSALRWTGRVDGTAIPLEKSAASVRLVEQGQLPAAGCQTGMLSNKMLFGHLKVCGQTFNIPLREQNRTIPTAAVAAPCTGELL